MESMASISVSTRLPTGSIISPATGNVDKLTSEVWTGQPQNRIIPISRYPAKILSQHDFRLGDASCIEDFSHIFGLLHYRDFFKSIQFLLPHLLFEAHLDFELVCMVE
jgi:hypothetical protein